MPKAKAPELVRFGENVRKRREEREWTQEQLARVSCFRFCLPSRTQHPGETLNMETILH